ncbi:MAG: hypothetical protein ACRDQA_00135 [Nocardioidaceae bacterium]
MPTSADNSPSQRIAEAAALLPGYGAIGGWASAYWPGMRLLDGRGACGTERLPVLLCLGAGRKIHKRPGISLSREILPDSDVVDVRGLACTSPLRTTFDGCRLTGQLRDAVVFVDMMLTCGAITLPRYRAYVEQHGGWKGVPMARSALTLAAAGTRSPPETRLRLMWMLEAGLPTPVVNRPVFSLDGELLGVPDIIEPESATVGEYDGDDHPAAVNHTDDNEREELFEDHNLTVMRATRIDLRWRRSATVARMRGARARGLRRDHSHDRWTLEPPPWWTGR